MRRWFVILLVLTGLLTVTMVMIIPTQAATSMPSRTTTIQQNAAGHMYFSPTFPACVRGNVMQIKLINRSRQVARLLFGKPTTVLLRPGASMTTRLYVQTPMPNTEQFVVVMLEPRGDAYADVMLIVNECP